MGFGVHPLIYRVTPQQICFFAALGVDLLFCKVISLINLHIAFLRTIRRFPAFTIARSLLDYCGKPVAQKASSTSKDFTRRSPSCGELYFGSFWKGM